VKDAGERGKSRGKGTVPYSAVIQSATTATTGVKLTSPASRDVDTEY
jgi:hypothetical protein